MNFRSKNLNKDLDKNNLFWRKTRKYFILFCQIWFKIEVDLLYKNVDLEQCVVENDNIAYLSKRYLLEQHLREYFYCFSNLIVFLHFNLLGFLVPTKASIGKMSKKAKGVWSLFLCFTKALGASILEEEGVGAAQKLS